MSKVIGIVAEGPTDYLVLKTAVDRITNEENTYRSLQPEPNMIGKYGNGWKGVWKWCWDSGHQLRQILNNIIPKIDIVIIQMDGDVVRKEKEVHCICKATRCEEKGKTFPLFCEKAKDNCPVCLPCSNHDALPEEFAKHGRFTLREALGMDAIDEQVLITIPCDSTDAWVVAAYDDAADIELIEDPWRNVIARKKEYHGIRVRGDRKNTLTYQCFLPMLSMRWEVVAEKCRSARMLEDDMKRALNR